MTTTPDLIGDPRAVPITKSAINTNAPPTDRLAVLQRAVDEAEAGFATVMKISTIRRILAGGDR